MLEQGFGFVSPIPQGAFCEPLKKTLWVKRVSVGNSAITYDSETFKVTMFKPAVVFAGDSVGQQLKVESSWVILKVSRAAPLVAVAG